MVRDAYKPLHLRKLKKGAGFHQASAYRHVRADSPAIEVMTDLRQVAVATVRPNASIDHATQVMIARGVRLLLVIDGDGAVVGLITARDTMGEKPIKLLQERGGRHDELLVSDLMTPREDIEVLELETVEHAEVGHIVTTLKACGRQHALVVDHDPYDGSELVRGIFSATQIGRQLGALLQTVEIARTFADIESVLSST